MITSLVEVRPLEDPDTACMGLRESACHKNSEYATIRNFAMSLAMISIYAGGAIAQPCVQPRDQQAFDLIALKSSLMVAALSCNESDFYNAFMTRFQPNILAEQQAMDEYFNRAYGLDWQAREDSFVTDLANGQAVNSGRPGTDYCSGTGQLFGQVLASKSWNDLLQLTTAKPALLPVAALACGAPAPQRTPEEIETAEAKSMLVRNQPPPAANQRPVAATRRTVLRLAHNDPRPRKPLPAKVPKAVATMII